LRQIEGKRTEKEDETFESRLVLHNPWSFRMYAGQFQQTVLPETVSVTDQSPSNMKEISASEFTHSSAVFFSSIITFLERLTRCIKLGI